MHCIRNSRDRLAVDGGAPARQTCLPYARQLIDEDDIQAVVEVLRSDWLVTGPKVEEFEEEFSTLVGARYAVSFSSGTAALHAAVFAAGLGPGDEAIVPPMTFCATANCLLYQGATPVFADVCHDTLTLDPEQAMSRATQYTRAILPVDYAGHPADLNPIMEFADRNGLIVIEDACHALGSEYRGRKVGGIAHMTVFSFHPVKHITTGEGGMVTTNDAGFAHRLRQFRNHGIDRDAQKRQAANYWQYEMVALGWNYRLSDISCALGLSQLSKLPTNLEHRRQIADRYNAAFRGLPGMLLPVVREHAKPAWHLYPIRLDPCIVNASRDEVFGDLRAENIGVNVHYLPVHLHSYYRNRFGYRGGEFPVAEVAFERLLSLPMFHGMTDADVEDVIAAVSRVIMAFSELEAIAG